MRRPKPTLMDYVVIAINPALVMVLVGSLIYFLLELFYQGQYPNKLHFCLTMFIFAAVLISRISMEEGWERAAPFGLALGVAICLAMRKYVEYPPGSSLAEYGWLVNYSLIAVAWWCAHQLTWDSTLIDESQDSSGEGLLQSTGLDNAENVVEKQDATSKSKSNDKGQPADKASPSTDPFNATGNEFAWASVVIPVQPPKRSTEQKKSAELNPSLSAKHDSRVATSDEEENQSWWQRMIARRRRAHAPGVWVVYFSLFALPMFGLGQAIIPISNTASRRYAFVLLCVYVASALGLLLTTSFLGLRRYLRQRRLEMPAAMAGVWLATGAILIAVLIGLTALLPRPNAEYQISQSPFAESEDQKASPYSAGGEGTKDDQAATADGTRSRPDKDAQSPDQSSQPHPEGRDTSKTNGTKSTDGEAKKSGGGEGKNNESSNEKSDHRQSNSDNSQKSSGDSKQSSTSDNKSSQPGEKSSQQQANQSQSNQQNSESPQSDSSQSKSQSGENKSQSNQNNSQANQNISPGSQSPATPPTPDLSILGTSLQNFGKWVVYALLGLLALWLLIVYWSDVLSWINRFLQSWQEFFARLFGGGRDADDEGEAAPKIKPKSFFEYPDPFENGQAARMTPGELTRYSFEALEAWASDNGCSRETDQTPLEFAKQIGEHAPQLATAARTLTELYNRQAYAKGTLTAASVEHVRNFWLAILEPVTQGAGRGGSGAGED